MILGIRAELPSKRSVIACAPTGSGKTVLALHMISGAVAKKNRVIFCVHRKQLLDQTSAAFSAMNIPHGFIAAGRPESDSLVSVAMLQTLQRKLDKVPLPSLMIVDEAHISSSRGADSVIQWARDAGAMIVGLTATPKRTDGGGLDKQYGAIIQGPSMAWLIENKYLSPYEIYGPEFVPDMSKVGTKMGDYIQEQAEKILNNKAITGDAVAAYKYHADGKACIVFANSVQHAHDVAADFCAAGYKFVAVDAETPDDVRRQAISDLAARKIHGICNYALFLEGMNVELVECVILQRATKSLIVWLQAIGRGLRYIEGKTCIILDQTGNAFRPGLGLPCDDREWPLEGKKKRAAEEKPIALKHCAKCKAIYATKHTSCPRCGAVSLIAHHEIKTKKGALKAITKEDIAAVHAARKKRKTEEWQADTYDKLVALAEQRGYDNPKYWARMKIGFRRKKDESKSTGNKKIRSADSGRDT